MRWVLIFAAGCGQTYLPFTLDTGTSTIPVESEPSYLVTHSIGWEAGECAPVDVAGASIIQLIVCNDTPSDRQCWPDAESRLTLIGGTAYVLCPDDPYSPDAYILTWITAG